MLHFSTFPAFGCSIMKQKTRKKKCRMHTDTRVRPDENNIYMDSCSASVRTCTLYVTFIKLHCIYLKFESCDRTVYFMPTSQPASQHKIPCVQRLLVLYYRHQHTIAAAAAAVGLLLQPLCIHLFSFRLHSRHECQIRIRNYHRHHLYIIYFHHHTQCVLETE